VPPRLGRAGPESPDTLASRARPSQDVGVDLPRALRIALFAPYLAVFYPLLAIRRGVAALRPGRAWRTWITPQLLLGGFVGPGDVEELRRLGIGAVVNVSRELYDPRDALRAAGMAYLRVPCWDMRAPTLPDAARGVGFIADAIARGERVYVHCASGVGRSVSLALCYLAAHEGYEIEEAVRLVTRLRPRVAMSAAQRELVHLYVESRPLKPPARTRPLPPATGPAPPSTPR
jgi:hypothetical protein